MKILFDKAEFITPDKYTVGGLKNEAFAVSCSWNLMSEADYIKFFKAGGVTSVRLEFFDPRTKKIVQTTMRMEILSGSLTTINGKLWWADVSCEFSEGC